MSLGLLRRGEDARRFAHVVRALAGPRDVGGVLGGEDVDRHAVHHQGAVGYLNIKTTTTKTSACSSGSATSASLTTAATPVLAGPPASRGQGTVAHIQQITSRLHDDLHYSGQIQN